MPDWLVPLERMRAELQAEPDGKPYVYPIRHGTMRVGLYAPKGSDPQRPHDQDELYIIASGTGVFVKAGERRPFGPGDTILVEAAVEHRFEEFSPDFATWVVFWGPQGGEATSG